ncbi:hypothetical protein HDA32_001245 [Spinactinospora alkalitolerans]|uniref:Uncharacterized protein n=1 Tax=Spinactinospora alkalitolerans TaxID=687207 RepID=A0A852TRE2_9ACTN|nr:hypothetical protein [Spinactinospora alkalitolerans]NYE46125.1 hypothetical protein [Spinactinospora alkalitolerans]
MPIDVSVSAPGRLDDHERLRLYIEGVRERAAKAVSWGPETVGIPAQPAENALLRINDVAFYANARSEIIAFADTCLNLLSLHRPRDGGGVSSGPAPMTQRCRCCMLRWPCPTVTEMAGLLK